MRKYAMVILGILVSGYSIFADTKVIDTDTFLTKVLEEYRHINREEILADLRYKYYSSENGIQVSGGLYGGKKNSTNGSSYIDSYNNTVNDGSKDNVTNKYGIVELSKTSKYGTGISVKNIYSDTNSEYGPAGTLIKENEVYNQTEIVLEQSLYRNLLAGFLNDKQNLNNYKLNKNYIQESENYIVKEAFKSYISYQNTKKEIEKLNQLNQELINYITDLKNADSNSVFRISKIIIRQKKIETVIAMEKDYLNLKKYTLCRLINIPFSENEVEFKEISKEQIIAKYSELLEKMYDVKIAKNKIVIDGKKLDKEEIEIYNLPEIRLYGKTSFGKDEGNKDDNGSTSGGVIRNEEYVIGLKIKMELFDGITDSQIKFENEKIKISEEKYRRLVNEYKEIKKISKLQEKTAYDIMGIKENEINEIKTVVDNGKEYLKGLLISKERDDRQIFNDEQVNLINNINELTNLYIEYTAEVDSYYRMVFADRIVGNGN